MSQQTPTELAPLVGMPCLRVTYAPETGNDLLLDLGEWVRYTHQSAKLKSTHRGEWVLMFRCPWYLHARAGAEISWTDVHDLEPWQVTPRSLEGREITSLLVDAHSHELQITFSEGFKLVAVGASGEWFALGPNGEEIVSHSVWASDGSP